MVPPPTRKLPEGKNVQEQHLLLAICALIFIFYLSTALLLSHALAQQAYLESDKVKQGDVVVMIVEFSNNTTSLYALDTSPLQALFEVLEVKSSVKRIDSEGSTLNVMRWVVELYPRQNGVLKIPSLNIKGNLTPELQVEIMRTPELVSNQDRVTFNLTATATPQNPYVGEQIIFTTRLIYNRPLIKGLLAEPDASDVEVYPHGEDRYYDQEINGEVFSVLERRFSLIARLPGELSLAPIVFRGEIDSRKGGDATSNGKTTRKIKRDSQTLSLNIRAPAENLKASYWLPARQLKLSQQWILGDKNLTVGDTITRTVTIEASGLPATDLPANLLEVEDEAIEVYPDRLSTLNQIIDNQIIGKLEQGHVIVLSRAGEIVIPEIRLKWWDVNEDVEKMAFLPGKTLVVAEAEQQAINSADLLSNLREQQAAQSVFGINWSDIRWLLIIAVSFSSLILVWFIFAMFRRLKNTRGNLNYRFNPATLKRACFGGDALTARLQLISWARQRWPHENFAGLYKIKLKFDSVDLDRELRQLDAALFSKQQHPWKGQHLWHIFIKQIKPVADSTPKPPTVLPGLYPG